MTTERPPSCPGSVRASGPTDKDPHVVFHDQQTYNPSPSQVAPVNGDHGPRDVGLVFIGDSFVAGYGDPKGLGWVSRVVSRTQHPDVQLSAYNLGIRGDSSADVLGRWRTECPPRWQGRGERRPAVGIARDIRTRRGSSARVAIKEMNLARQPRKELLIDEIMIMKESRHPNIINFLDAFLLNENRMLWVVMDYMEGGALIDIIDNNPEISEAQIATICKEVR